MMKKKLFCMLSAVILCSVSHADVLFKMEAPTTDLVLGGPAVTVTVSAWADDLEATGTNGLNYWALSALVDTDGVAEVVGSSIIPLNLTTGFETDSASVNQIGTGGTGSIDYLNTYPSGSEQPSGVGVGGYTPIAQFDIQAIGSVGQSVTYTLGDTGGFLGILYDGTTILDGQFDVGASQNVFTIVPEPATLLMLGLGTMLAYRRKK